MIISQIGVAYIHFPFILNLFFLNSNFYSCKLLMLFSIQNILYIEGKALLKLNFLFSNFFLSFKCILPQRLYSPYSRENRYSDRPHMSHIYLSNIAQQTLSPYMKAAPLIVTIPGS